MVGLACRVPGGPDPAAFWALLRAGGDAVREVPEGRPGTGRGGYLDRIDEFDPEFFGISPREAAAMDPQQRLVLELAWEALEDAGIRPADLHGGDTGVFVGSIADEYAGLARQGHLGRHTLTGTTRGIIANRVSYALGLRGPSIAVDTAQSSSLVAVHLACESLRRGETTAALAGGVNLIVDPAGTRAVAEFGGLSPDGRCHTFDRRANGYVRGEGAGLVLLKRLETALADGDRIYGVILGGAVNNDGATEGLTVPSADAQAEVVAKARAAAGVVAEEVQYVELHGTGTPVGDPIEARGLGQATAGALVAGTVVEVGSVKTNIGHLEGAAGIAGLLKVLLSVHNRHIPATLNHTEPNPDIDLAGLGLRVRVAGGDWPRPDGRLVAGVSSFGMGGTNCHLVVAEAPDRPVEAEDASNAPLVLSARTPAALRAYAERIAPHAELPGVARTLATTRTAYTERAAVTGDVAAGLAALAAGVSAPNVITGTPVPGSVAVIFPGQGSQRLGMGARAHRDFPVWRAAFDEIADLLREHLPTPLADVLWTETDGLLDRTRYTQPALFAVEVATHRLLESWGVTPALVAGHSIGEVAAAHVAGVLDLPAAVRLIAARGALMDELPPGGAMLAVAASEEDVSPLLLPHAAVAGIAAVNGAESVVVSGARAALEEIAASGLRTRWLTVGHGFHSPLMEPMLDEFRAVLDGIEFAAPRVPFVSTVTGELVDRFDADYWVRHARQPVRFRDGLRALRALGAGVFVEAGPGTTLTALARTELGSAAAFVPVLGKQDDPAAGLGGLFVAGIEPRWGFPPGPRVPLPTYPFQREPYWLDRAEPVRAPVAQRDLGELVAAELAAVLGHADLGRLNRSASFGDLGVDSLGVVELRDRLSAALGREVPVGSLYSHPTAEALAAHLGGGTTRAVVRKSVVDDDPVVIVGMGCRYPGGIASPEDLWRVVANGIDATGDFPVDRGWDLSTLFDDDPARTGTSYARRGGFLDGVGEFDAEFFGVSPREALAMDPQQRLLLQVTWEALERAGIDPTTLKGTDTGVYIGATTSDYAPRLHEGGGNTDGYLLTGSTPSVASGRIAYLLGLSGPALTIDTACSSSLVALDLAVRAVRSGECDTAIAGGAAVLASPGMFVEFSRQRGLSADGRCRAFGAEADGTAWAEGVGVVVVQRLSAARRDGHPVLAVVAGSAVNQDGASNGLSAPSGAAQERVVLRALAEAGLRSDDVDLVEAHGTGTRLGDPIEAQALIATYGGERSTPLLLGSFKSNIGHAQAAAGIGGVIKVVQAIAHGVVPRTLWADQPSPHVTWSDSGVDLVREAVPWPAVDRVRRAGVSSFGISGTNSHVIIEQAPEAEPAVVEQAIPILISATDPDALRRQAAGLADYLAAPRDLAQVADVLVSRTRLSHGAAVLADDQAGALAALRTLAEGGVDDQALAGRRTPGRTVFVFPGQGAQWPEMGRALLDTSPVFRASIEACAEAFAEHVDWSLLDVLRADPSALDRVDVVQPVLFAVLVSLAALWRSEGVEPDAVVGHSQGEIAAAHVAGALTLSDAARLVTTRAKALTKITGGGMMSVATSADTLRQALERWPDVSVAAVNGPQSTVVAGAATALDELAEWLEEQGIRARRVAVDYASHTRFVEPLRDELHTVLAGITPQPTEILFHSSLTAGPADGTELDAGYWYRNLREPVRFAAAVEGLAKAGHTRFIEVSPHPVLTVGVEGTLAAAGVTGSVLGTLRRERGDLAEFRRALAAADLAGIRVDWPRAGAHLPDLPTYAFERRRFWLAPTRQAGKRGGHPLLGHPVTLADGGTVATGTVDTATHAWLTDHQVFGSVLVPGTAIADLAAAVGRARGLDTLADITLEAPLPLDRPVEVQARLEGTTVTVHSRPGPDEPWTRNAVGTVEPGGDVDAELPSNWPPADAESLDLSGVYDYLAGLGYDYGPRFQGLTAAWRHGADVLAEIDGPDGLDGDFPVHPALLDAALHPVVAGLAGVPTGDPGKPLLPFAIEGLRIVGQAGSRLRVRITPLSGTRVGYVLGDADGTVIGTIASVGFRPMSGAVRERVHELDWVPATATRAPGSIAVLGDPTDVVDGDVPDLGDSLPDTVLVPARASGESVVDDLHALTGDVLVSLQQLLGDPRLDGARFVVVHRSDDLAAAGLRGLVRSAAAEHPGRVGLVTVDAPATPEVLAAVDEPEARIRAGAVFVPRLVVRDLDDDSRGWPDGTVLITGGTGALGVLVAQHIAASSPAHLLLVNRSGRADLLDDLRGANVTVAACDVADRASLAALIDSIPADRPLRAVVHAAGVLDDATIGALTPEQVARVLAPKADAAWYLHELTRDLPLDRFVLFSSAVAVVGAPGQANYAAANAFLDALAEHRAAEGLPATSIAWGLWTAAGAMTDHLDHGDHARLARRGVGLLEPEAGLAVLDRATASHVVKSPLDLAVLRREAEAGTLLPVLSGLVSTVVSRPTAGGAWARRLAGERPEDRRRVLAGLLREQAAAVLGHDDATRVDAERAFKDLGFDSLTAVELRNRLAALTGVALPATVVFEHPSVAALAEHLVESLFATKKKSVTTVVKSDVDNDPVVIVGMGCRYPGGIDTPDDLWRVVAEGVDATGDFPTDRGWDLDALFHQDPDHHGTTYTRRGGFLHDAGEFDADFFGMSPREALATDPQHRLLLQVTWEAFERAGIDPTTLKGTDTGVYIGAMYDDYAGRLRTAPPELEGLLLAGNQSSVASGRIAYLLGLSGPALTVDTACSSSLVALDLAVRAVRSGECSLAVAGGVAVMATPGIFVEFSRQRGLSADGRCRSYGDGADGTGWAEGAGVVVVERLSAARRAGHRVLAVVAGSATNQDGASNGLTAPSGGAQERVIHRALADAGLTPTEVDVVEGHGTGTRLGDPIEARALISVYGGERERPLLLGSLKSNIGHAQAAAGVGGVIKVVEALRHGLVPKTLWAEEPSAHVPWDGSGVHLVGEPVAWPDAGRPRRAGVSSFGISGTNAHVIIEQAPAAETPVTKETGVPPLVISAKSAAAVRAQAGRLLDVDLDHDAAHTLAGRTRFAHRAVVLGGKPALEALRDGVDHPGVVTGSAADGRLAFVFSGQGSQRAGMGTALIAASPVFAAAFDVVAEHVDPLLDVPLRDLLTDADRLAETRYAQPALFALQVAAYREVERFGVRPDVLIGHSIGEYAAAHVAGVFDLADAAAAVVARGRLMQSARPGAMAALEAAEDEVPLTDGVEIAAVNGPRSLVISGDAAPIDALVARWKESGRRATRLKVGHAFHSAHLDDVLAEFRTVLDGVRFAEPRLPIASTATGDLGADLATADYWVAQLRGRVRFADAVRAAGATRFLELGPDGGLVSMVQQTVEAAVAVPLLPDAVPALGALLVAGVDVDLTPLFPDAVAVEVPTYPFETRRYWLDVPLDRGSATDLGLTDARHPLLSAQTDLPDGVVASGTLSVRTHPWLAEHQVDGRAVVPAVALLDVVAAFGSGIDDFVVHAPLVVDSDVRVQALAIAGEVTVRGRAADAEEWTVHATARLVDHPAEPTGQIRPKGERVDLGDPYPGLAERGYGYGPLFQGLRAVWRDGGDLVADVEVPAEAPDGVIASPALLDAALHALVLDGARRVPFALDGVRVRPSTSRRARVQLSTVDTDAYRVRVTDTDGVPILVADRLRLRAIGAEADLHQLRWESATVPTVVDEITVVRVATAEDARAAISTAGETRLVFVTNGVPVDDTERADAGTAAVWGLVRSAQAEHPGRFALVDAVDPDPGLLAAVATAWPETAIRGATVLRPTLIPDHANAQRVDLAFADDLPVLVTGGTGALGRRVARHLVTRHGVRNLVLVNRSGAAVDLDLADARVTVRACDVADPIALTALLADLGPLGGVVHAAGVVDDALVESLDADALAHTLAVKAGAAATLDALTADLPFVLFGSVAGVLGTAGQSAYAAANAALDAVAHERRRAGKHALVVHWGLWDTGDGMTAHLTDRDRDRLARAGIRPMSTDDGLALFDRALASGATSVVAATLDLPAARAWRAHPARVEARHDDLARRVLAAVAAVLGHDSPADIDPDRPFAELGFDSLMAVDLRNRLTARLGVRLATTIVFDHPTPNALITFVGATLVGAEEPARDVRAPVVAEDAIAIVGMACKLPGGVGNPDELWAALRAGTDAITEFPADRGWDTGLFDPDPAAAGTSYTRHGGFLHDAAEFDAEFFGISPREALAIDPQQRLLLQSAWAAVEDAGIDPATLRGSATGVYIGLMYSDYGARVHQRPGGGHELEGYLVSGSAGSVASGRVSYSLGLEGPAVTIDTACSSSLVALHSAANALRQGECALALAGGATVMASPATFVEFSRQRGLAPDGRCKPFSTDADGTAWAEGVGLLVLERLADAERNGHRVLAIVRGSAVNQDGASNGLTAPNGPAQERVIRRALSVAGLEPGEVDVLEAHGTGTRLGDPIEAGAVLATYGRDRRAPLLMGSVKSNLGHTQAAAGVAGVIKLVQAMRHGELPASLHVGTPSEHVDWSSGAVVVPAETTPWPASDHPRRAAVSSFGIGGTNAHVVLEQGPVTPPRAPVEDRPLVWVLSARTDVALREQAARLRHHVENTPHLRHTDLALSLATTRTPFTVRAAVVGRTHENLVDGLQQIADGASEAITGTPANGDVALLFTGQGSQRVGMGTLLHQQFPVYAAAFDAVREEFLRADGIDVSAAIAGTDLDRTRFTQAALFAVEVALARLLLSWGLPVSAAAGHSIGELAAAHVAGALTLPDAVAIVAARGRLMQELPEGGAMVSVRASEAEVAALVGSTVDIAAVNGPNAVVISGAEDAVLAAAATLAERGHRTKRLTVSHAFHSALMDPMLPAFRTAIGSYTDNHAAPTFPVVSTLTAADVDVDADHWVAQVRGTVRFADAVAALRERGVTTFVEVGPDTVLAPLAEEAGAVGIPTLNRRHDEVDALWTAVARGFVAGVAWDWRALFGADAEPVPLPTYPFARDRYWLDAPPAEATAAGLGVDRPDHPLLSAAVAAPGGDQTIYTSVLSHVRQPWLADHAVHGTVLLPAAAIVELAAWVGARHGSPHLAELVLPAPLVVGPGEEVDLRVTADHDSVRVHARASGTAEWTLHAEGVLAADGVSDEWDGGVPAVDPLAVTDFYATLEDRGYHYGPAFQGLTALSVDGTTRYAEVDTPPGPAAARLDAALHGWLVDTDGAVEVPYAWRDVRVHGEVTGPLRVRITATGESTFALAALDATGRPVVTAAEVRLRPAEGVARRVPAPYELAWVPADSAKVDESAEVLVVEPEGDPRTAFHTVRDLILTTPESTYLVIVTRGAVAAAPGDTVPNPEAAVLWGLVRTARTEYPGRIGIIDVDDHPDSRTALTRLTSTRPGQIALRAGEVLVPRLRQLSATGEVPGFGDGTVLLTGAGGALGAAIARHLVDRHGVRDLLLVSRRGDADPALRDLATELGALATVRTAACDVADPEATARLLDDSVTAVVHSAGVVADSVLASLTEDQVDRVFRAKVDAALTLHRLTADRPLAAFVLFSSVAGVVGNAGQANYAAANAFLDSLAAHRRAAGLAGTSLAWGLWDEGMGAALGAAERARVAALGIRAVSVADGLAQFDAALAAGPPAVAPVVLDPRAWTGHTPEVFADLAPRRAEPAAVSLVERVSTLDNIAARQVIRATVTDRVAQVLGFRRGAAVPEDAGLFDIGLDSLTALELRNRLGADVGAALPATLLFDHPNVTALTEHLVSHLVKPEPAFDQSLLDTWVKAAGERPDQLADALRAALSALGEAGSPVFGMGSVSDDELFGVLDQRLGE
ncbi:type I polyketide synthase [Actinokineospora sp. NBRC 105648]|uniref:type I polyketide synthase n=1 Tax=Actinokineospora sp. NBRC 105648 TaxID=3032206 RepID=UPI002555A511|nr:type I polyketide synthase [Actinokineospora sp. NBRC 105648]